MSIVRYSLVSCSLTLHFSIRGRVEKEVIDDMKKIDRKEVTVKRSFSSAAVLSRLARSNTILSTHTEREQESAHTDSFEGKGLLWNFFAITVEPY